MKLTPIRRIQVTPKLRYALALARHAETFAAQSGRFYVFDREMVRFGRIVLAQCDRQEARRRRRLAALAKLPNKAVMVGVVDVRLQRKRRA